MQPWKKKFITIWSGQLFSILSSTIAQFAIILWISLETGSAEVLAFATIAGMVPQIILGAFAGVFVDRWNRKWTMILADSFVALCSGVIAWLFYLDVVELWHIYLLLMLRSVGGAFHTPAMKASIPLLAPESELTRIAGINQSIQAVCTICGPVMGAALIVSTNMSVIMLLDVAGAIIACTALLFVVIP
ncbi:MAG: MFS transporter, partial [Bacteroides sp.]